MAENIGALKAFITLDGTGFSKAMAGVRRQMRETGRQMQSVGRSMSLALTAPITGFGVLVARTAGDFEASMNRVGAVSGATSAELDMLRTAAKDMGRTTQFSASEAADALGFLAMAGFDANEATAGLPGTLQLAAAAGVDLAKSADIVSNVLSGYGMRVAELGRVNDVLVATLTSSNTNLEQLGEAMAQAGPIAASAGISFEEASASIGLLGNAGIQASLAGTTLKNAISKMLLPTDAVKAKLDALGITFTDARGRLLPLADIIEQLEPIADDTGLMLEVFGQRAGPGMAALVSQGSGALRELTGELEDSAGTAARIAATQMEGFNGALKELKSAFEALQIAIGDSGVLKFFEQTVDRLKDIVLRLSEASPELLRLGSILAGLAAIIGPLLVILGTLSITIGALVGSSLLPMATAVSAAAAALIYLADAMGFSLLDAAEALAGNIERIAFYAGTAAVIIGGKFAVGLAVAAVRTASLSGALVVLRGALVRTGIGALVVGVGEVIYQFNELIETTGSLGNLMKLFGDLAKEVWDRFVMRLDIVKMRFEIFGLRIKQVWLEVISFLAEKFSGFAEKVAAPFNKLAETIGVDARIDPFGLSEWSKNISGSVASVESEIESLKASIASTDEQASAPFQAFTDAVIRAREEANSTTSAAERLAEALGSSKPGGGKLKPEKEDNDTETPSTGGGGGGGSLFDKIADAATKATDKIAELAKTTKSFAEQAGGAVGNALSGMLDGLIQGTFNARDALRQLASDLFRLASQSIFKQLLGGFANGGGFLGGLATALGGARASGGPVNPGVPYLVGEKGPELVVPRTKSQVIPNHQIGGLGGGVGSGETAAPEVNVNNVILNDEARLGDYLQKGPGKRLVTNIVRLEMESFRG